MIDMFVNIWKTVGWEFFVLAFGFITGYFGLLFWWLGEDRWIKSVGFKMYLVGIICMILLWLFCDSIQYSKHRIFVMLIISSIPLVVWSIVRTYKWIRIHNA